MHGKPALPDDFASFPYVDPDAPKGGRITYAVQGNFDSVNPYIVKGAVVTGVNTLTFETVMRPSADEPFSFYPSLAETVEVPEDRSWVEFKINPKARFSDGHPVTAQDLQFSWELLKTRGRPNVRASYAKVKSAEIKDPLTIRFDLSGSNDREMPLILCTMTVLPKHATNPETFEQSTLTPLIGSGPYRIESVKAGQSITFRKNPDWWAQDLPANRGLFNFEEIRFDYYSDVNSMFEAFKAGLYDVRAEQDAARWAQQYDFPALRDGRVSRQEIENKLPKPMTAFVFNTRRPLFQDVKVREALAMLFDFEWANHNLFFDLYARPCSFFDGSELSSCGRAADEKERALLAAFPGAVRADILEGQWRPPASDGSGKDRTVTRRALALLKEAGFSIQDGMMRREGTGEPLAFQIMVVNKDHSRLSLNYAESLKRVGVEAKVQLVDDVLYQTRRQTFDYDMILGGWQSSLSPGNEQNFRWSAKAADAPGSFNFAGVKNPAADALIGAILSARSREDFVAAVRAFDRVLLSGHYVVPLYYSPKIWMARWTTTKRPVKPALALGGQGDSLASDPLIAHIAPAGAQ